ncbi:MAG: prolyl oligopeptidase family serine peptidase [Prevotella sp.]|nr:prolyl oligopeptidase family serine peptidase [Prevotella sp.]MDY5546437.1 prolyl oligopeptidase family serine peptidase [Prevotella sp.]
MKNGRFLLLVAAVVALPVCAWQGDGIHWQQAEHASEKNVSPRYYASAVNPSWIGQTSLISFDRTQNGKKEMFLLDPKEGTSQPLIKDIPSFIRQYSTLTGDTSFTEKQLKLYGIDFRQGDTSRFFWRSHGKRMVYDRRSGILTMDTTTEEPKSRHFFPGYGRSSSTTDSLYTMLGDRYNLYVRNNKTGKLKKLTNDGKDYDSYCYRSKKDEIKEGNAAGFWLGHIYLDFITDDSEVGELYIINSLAQPRPKLITKKMPLPNEKGIRRFKLWWYDADKDEGRFLNIDRFKDQNVALDYNRTEQALWFTCRSRSVDTIQLCRIDVPTGKVKVVIQEICKPHLSVNLFNYRFIDNGKHIVWWSERTGKGNYYLYDTNGKLLNRITRGNSLVAGNIEYVDTVNRTLTFAGYGAERGVNPYYRFYYRAKLDGKHQQLLSHGDGYHEMQFSADRHYAIDRYSRMDMPPVYNLVDLKSPQRYFEIVRNTTDTLLAAGWHAPKLITVKAADGKTDLYGLMYTPSNLDPVKKYPIISNVYPGPQDDQIPLQFTIDDSGNQSLAELGFIVINVAPRGSSPYRGRDFLAFGYGNLRDYPLADNRKVILELAQRYSYIDTTRVGIYGHSGGGFETVASMLTYPDFYKVGVAASGNHDNNIYIQWWGETWNGLKHIPTNMELAANLKGKLLLISGDVDDNVPFANTLRMADALIKNNKRFDMMVLPGKDHGVDGPYYQNLIRYYFLENLVNPSKRDIDIVNHK